MRVLRPGAERRRRGYHFGHLADPSIAGVPGSEADPGGAVAGEDAAASYGGQILVDTLQAQTLNTLNVNPQSAVL